MKPSEKYTKMILGIQKCTIVIGADVYDPKYRPNIVTYGCIALLSLYFGFTIATVWKLFSQNPVFLLEAFATSSCGMQAFVKYYCCCFLAAPDISSTNNFIVEVYQRYEDMSAIYLGLVTKNLQYMLKIMKIIMATYVVPSSLIILTPIVYNMLTGQRHLMLHFHIPGLDLEKPQHHSLTLAIQTVMVVLCVIGLCASDLLMTTFLMQPLLFCDIFKRKVAELNEFLELRNAIDEQTMKLPSHLEIDTKISLHLYDMIDWHQLSLSITGRVNNMFAPIITTVILTSACALIITLFILLTGTWPSGYTFIIICLYSLYIYCFIGTRIEKCNEDFINAIYNINWYNMTAGQQKLVRFILMRSYKPKRLLVANVLPLSVQTGLSITKTIYSVFMMMLQMLA